LYVFVQTYFLPIWPQLPIRWSVFGVLSPKPRRVVKPIESPPPLKQPPSLPNCMVHHTQHFHALPLELGFCHYKALSLHAIGVGVTWIAAPQHVCYLVPGWISVHVPGK
jgi:hypothetical protein